jgi:hypothetical protein
VIGERGQATVEWVGLVALVALALSALAAAALRADGRAFGGALAHALVCAARGGCDDGDADLARTYGRRDAELVRLHAPGLVYERGIHTLPVDFRACRAHRCSDAPDDRDLDVHRSARGGLPATAFTRLIRRDGETFVQYWLYYPDSTTTWGGAKRAWSTAADPRAAAVAGPGGALAHQVARRVPYPGGHRDDWESYQVRIDARGRAWSRASSHHGYRSCKQRACEGRWLPATGWTRVSRGSHAGHVPWATERTWHPARGAGVRARSPELPGHDLRERTSTAAALRLVPLEAVEHDDYERLYPGVSPPWEKRVYVDPLHAGTG